MSTWRRQLTMGVYLLWGVILASACAFAGGVRNGGTIVNVHGAVFNVKSFANGKGATTGTVLNGGTINVATGGTFFNYDSAAGGTGAGAFTNTYGNSYGTLSTFNFDNGSTHQGIFVNDSSGPGGGTVIIGGSFTNGTAADFTTLKGAVQYDGVAQTISNAVNGNTYGTLRVNGSGASVLGGSITVTDTIDLSTGSGTFDLSGNNLTMEGTVKTGGPTLVATGTGSTTTYGKSGAQSVLPGTYYNLAIQGNGQKTAGGAIVVAHTLSVSASTDSLDLGANSFTLQPGGSVSSSGKLMSSGSVNVPPLNPTIGGTFVYYGATQGVAGANYTNLLLRGGSFTLPGTDTVAVAGSYSLEGTTTTTYQSGNTFAYNGSGGQAILGGQNYYRVIAEGSADTSVTNAKTVGGVFSVQNAAGAGLLVLGNTTLDMGSDTVTFGAAHTDSVEGTARIRWARNNQYIAGTGLTELYGSGAATLAQGTYGYLRFSGTGTKSISGAVIAQGGSSAFATNGVRIDNNLNVTSTGSLTINGIDFNNNGTLTNAGAVTVN